MSNFSTLVYGAIATIIASIIGGVAVYYITSESYNYVEVKTQFITVESRDYSPTFQAYNLKSLMINKGIPVYDSEKINGEFNVSIVALDFSNNTNRKIESIEIIARNLIFAFEDSSPFELISLTGNGLLKIGELNIDQDKKIFIGVGYSSFDSWEENVKIVADSKRIYPRLDSGYGFFSTTLGLVVLTLGVIGIFPLALVIVLMPLAIIFQIKPELEFKYLSEKDKDKRLKIAKKIIEERRSRQTEVSDKSSDEILREGKQE
jgi:hypothetical protein